MKKEIWREVPEYEGIYQVSNLGRVRSLKFNKQRILKLTSDCYGYYRCSLWSKGKPKKIRIHKLVAISFLNHIACGMKIVIDHIDNNKKNNKAENLQLTSQRENSSKDKKGCSSKYVGVYWNKAANKWHAQIRVDGKSKYLGLFANEMEASEAYQAKLTEISI